MTGCCRFVPNDINSLFIPSIIPNQTKIRLKYGVLKTFAIKNRDHDHIFRDTEIPPNFHFLLHPIRQKVTGDLSRCHPPKKFRENNKKKDKEKWSFTQNEVNIRKNATQKPLWKTGFNPGKTDRKLTRYLKRSHLFHMWQGRKFPKSQG